MDNLIPIRSVVAALLGWLLLTACSTGADCEQNPDIAKVEAPVQLERLEKPFFQIKNPAEAQRFIEQHPLFARQYLLAGRYEAEQLTQTMTQLATNVGLQKLGRETEAAFQNTDSLQQELRGLFQHVRYYYPSFRVPPVKTFVSGLGKEPSKDALFANDSLIVLSLDFFVGPTASYRADVPAYINRRYTPTHVLPALALTISSKYNRGLTGNHTMLRDMVQFGKSLYFAEKMLPCMPDSLLIGYTNKELAGVQFNEGKIWAHFIEKNLLYTADPFVIKKYIGERPSTPEIDKTAPGRLGVWVGWQIVRKYMEQHPETTLPQLMAQRDAQRILNDSHYKPKRK
ncbi:gliding motility lipoprotein GldB [Hymenobacter aerilatus]|uniref:Gliding motility lipoprotein GldB n=1 Tax=Hymenobacter aerilatus TaxID=2932251 RepID=A0A8T9SQH2_9BACT|nr:gliding motility lipoprotein GldB [Hymenobacter aerilatus]UOR04322.1 gliding motility lipoprotein GldB [Hymenobacter aerilatus]